MTQKNSQEEEEIVEAVRPLHLRSFVLHCAPHSPVLPFLDSAQHWAFSLVGVGGTWQAFQSPFCFVGLYEGMLGKCTTLAKPLGLPGQILTFPSSL